MPAKRISQLDPIAGASTANNDNLVIFDTDANQTKRILRSQLAIGLAGDLPYTPSGSISANTIQAAIAELDSESARLTSLAAAGGAALIGNTPAGTIAATTVQAAINELAGDIAAISSGTGANPSASVGLSAVNGSATTFIRSDGAPALDQAISPTWSGNHTFSAVITASGISVTGTTVPGNGTYLPSANTVGFSTNSTARGTISSAGNWTINAPGSGVALYVNAVSGTHSAQIEDSAGTAYNAGYLEVPPNSQTVGYTAVLADSGKHILMDGSSLTATIPANGSVAYPVGTVLTIININASALSIAITSDTMTLAGGTSTGTRTLSQNGLATAIKITSTSWIITGTGLT
jgi:hypothetical protein